MEENQQSQENLKDQEFHLSQTQYNQDTSPKWIKIALLVFGGLILIIGSFYIGVRFTSRQEVGQVDKTEEKTLPKGFIPSQTVSIPVPTEIITFGKLAFIRENNLWLLNNNTEK